MRLYQLAFAFSLCGMVAACASPYHPASYDGGYRDAQIGSNTFRVTYQGNVTMKQADTDDLALLRAAEVSLDHGYAYFVSSGAAATGTAVSLATNVVSVPSSTLTITCFAMRPETSATVHDARRVVEQHRGLLK